MPRSSARPALLILSSILVFGAAACATPGPAVEATLPARATYRITRSTQPGGGGYEGTVVLTRAGEDRVIVEWDTTAGRYRGVGLRQGNTLFVGFGRRAEHGVTVYRLAEGALRGECVSSVSPESPGFEEVEGVDPNQLDGNHRVTRMRGGQPVLGGNLNIQRLSKEVHQLTWIAPEGEYKGVGILRGDQLAVGWGAGPNTGYIEYAIEAGGHVLRGVYAVLDDRMTYVETLTRQ